MSGGCRVVLDGHEYIVPSGENLLSALLKRGAVVAHSCLAGACGSCRLYESTGEPILSCQQTVSTDLNLLSRPNERFTVALVDYSFEELSSQWCKVKAHCSLSLPLGAVFRWQLGEVIGRSVSCSVQGGELTFYFPTTYLDRLDELRVEQGAQRARIDVSASHLLLYSATNQALAEDFASALQEYGITQPPLLQPIELSSPVKALAFQRFDKALILNDQPVSQTSLEDWLSSSRCRVADILFMTHTS